MTVRYQTWRRFTRVAAILALPAIAVIFFQPGRAFEVVAYVFVFGVGVSGALVAIMLRTGGLRFTYTDVDRQSIEYRVSSIARHMGIDREEEEKEVEEEEK